METKFKHTPGPWHSGCFVHNKDNPDGCQCRSILAETIFGSVCTISLWNGGDGIEEIDDDCPKIEEAIANSKLIAAAPELLDALMYGVEITNRISYPTNDELKRFTKAAIAAIKKATK